MIAMMMETMIPKWEDEVNEEDNAGDDGDHAKSHSSLGRAMNKNQPSVDLCL